MFNKIFTYLFYIKIKYILINLFFISLFVEIINLLEISKLVESDKGNIFNLFYLSILKFPTIIIEIIPFVIIISTAFVYRNLISNNEFISMRNIGFSIIDIFKPIACAIFVMGFMILIIINPIAAKSEKVFEKMTSKDFSNLYSINIKNDELWIKNIKNDSEKYFINIANIDLKNMNAEGIKILSLNNTKNYFYLSESGKLFNKKFQMSDVKILDINSDLFTLEKYYEIDLNFDKKNLLDSISNYKFVPYYNYIEHVESLKKFNLYSPEISLHYLSEMLKPFFLVVIGFIVMGYSGKFKRNENFFKVLFISILIGFSLFMFKEIIGAISIMYSISFVVAYLIIILIPILIGLYFVTNIEKN